MRTGSSGLKVTSSSGELMSAVMTKELTPWSNRRDSLRGRGLTINRLTMLMNEEFDNRKVQRLTKNDWQCMIEWIHKIMRKKYSQKMKYCIGNVWENGLTENEKVDWPLTWGIRRKTLNHQKTKRQITMEKRKMTRDQWIKINELWLNTSAVTEQQKNKLRNKRQEKKKDKTQESEETADVLGMPRTDTDLEQRIVT